LYLKWKLTKLTSPHTHTHTHTQTTNPTKSPITLDSNSILALQMQHRTFLWNTQNALLFCQDEFSKFCYFLKISFPISQDHFPKMLFLSFKWHELVLLHLKVMNSIFFVSNLVNEFSPSYSGILLPHSLLT